MAENDKNKLSDDFYEFAIRVLMDRIISLGKEKLAEGKRREAAVLFHKVAEPDSTWGWTVAKAQYNLGWLYEVGIDVGKDLVEAMKWYRNAAENGNAEAQYKLGHYYRSGVGIEKNYVEAVAWYRKAAEQGHSHAQERLARCYVRGAGVERNLEEAEKLLKKAVASAKGKTEKDRLQARYDSFVEMVLNGDDDSAYLWYRGQCSRE